MVVADVKNVSWNKVWQAVDQVRGRLQRVARLLDEAGIAYAVAGDNAVAFWVSAVDGRSLAALGQGHRLLMSSFLEQFFPGLVGANYRITSAPDRDYNCVAWAAGDTRKWWWPGRDLTVEYWPPGVPRELTRVAFEATFASIGYCVCDGESIESGYEKIAVFADADGAPTHVARQLPSGRWSSKLGAEDIEHGLRGVEGALYGTVAFTMKRSTSSPLTPVTAE
jgi:hypothetical protein